MIELERYYCGDDAWNRFCTLFVQHSGHPWVVEASQKLNGHIDLAYVIYGVLGAGYEQWIYQEVPALDDLRPVDCVASSDLVKRLRECLMRIH